MAQLTQKQQRFVASYVVGDGNAAKSARDAGYSNKVAKVVGCNLLQHPAVTSEIARHRLEIQRRHQIDQDKIIQMLLDIYDNSDACIKDKIRATREIGLICGLYTEK